MNPTMLDQYKLLFSAYNDEVSRFWSRFNILMGIQMGAFVGIVASIKSLVPNAGLFRLSLVLMTLYSFATTVITVRGHFMHEALLRALGVMEEDSKGELRILHLSRKASRIPVGFNQLIGICIALIFSVSWMVLLCSIV